MDKIIDLLKGLFDLNKVASVTLPGLVLAGAVALFLWQPPPVDTIQIAAKPNDIKLQPEQTPCPQMPELGGSSLGKACKPEYATSPEKPACTPSPFNLAWFDVDKKEDLEKEAIETLKNTTFFVRDSDNQKTRDAIEKMATRNGRQKWDSKVLKQHVLEEAKDRLTQCDEIETSRKGREETDNAQLSTDITNLDVQRKEIQDTYISYLKTNNPTLSGKYRRELEGIMTLMDAYREMFRINLVSIHERERRSAEIKRELSIINARLEEPGRLRPIKSFDIYVQGLVNHVVGIILLSIALSLILNAFDRATFGSLYELLWEGGT